MTATRTVAANPDLVRQAVNTIRFLAVDAVEQAKSGHPGMPMGMADVAFVLWTRFLRYQPHDPDWPARDRFVLSAGHGSMLLYALLHLAGYDLPLDELQRFRQLGSRTPGHPERGLTPGVETTTGPLGQGFGNGVGMALAAKMLAARFNGEAFAPAPQRVFGIVSDGDVMEGVHAEAASLAGHLGLGNLIYLYDDNHITIEGDTALAMSEDVAARFQAYGWHVQRAPFDDHEALATAVERAVAESARPSLILVRSHIGYGAPTKQDTREAHGEPLGPEEAVAAKRALGWPESPPFLVPAEVRALFAARAAALRREYDAWQQGLAAWRTRESARAAEWQAMMERRVPDDLYERLIAAAPAKAGATRAHGNAVLQTAAKLVPALAGGSADLEPSTKTRIADSASVAKDHYVGRNLHFGVREHAMGAMCNGMAVHGGFIPYGASFLVFTDYARPSIRLSALMKAQVIWVFTHDSVFLGEDGPTHQPVEHLTALRAIPNLLVVRPADGLETAAAWAMALERRDGPTLLALTRQNLPALERPAGFDARAIARGGYVIREIADAGATLPVGSGVAGARGLSPDPAARGGGGPVTIIATGSEVSLAIETAKILERERLAVRVVSMPAPQRFVAQDEAWREGVLPPGGRRVSLEAGATDYWHRLCGADDLVIGIDRFGESAPLAALREHFGFTPGGVAGRIRAWMRSAGA